MPSSLPVAVQRLVQMGRIHCSPAAWSLQCGLRAIPRKQRGTGMAETLVATVDGPRGKAEIYEVTSDLPSGALSVEYEVRSAGPVEKYPALGAAYIAAGE